ncbi:MAG: molybdate ABC transporter substrate-binding protein [Candidatus Eisenbacteria bacterium]|uniref:Molybdate ABC transporter substrate-binding protein n=1 Tax=Eiseniibacteriota bacterium TaxID=2212470 RepID=A0A849SJY4_UNCEI|nr:molybdate ABC transporter substrate-binding protein [Candidatus Eisenbacteria bacterium]
MVLNPGDAIAERVPRNALRVFAAASLAESFGELARHFEDVNPAVRVQLNLAGSQQLAAQLEQGAIADVFASADERWMDHVRQVGLVMGTPAHFARNRLVVIVPRTNPARIARLQDLARRGIKLVMGAESVPVGRYGREMLRNLASVTGFDPDFARRVLANVVSEEENVKAVVGKVQLGEADAGIVYRSDVTPALSRFVRTFEIPDSANVLTLYPIAVLAGTRAPELSRAFVELVRSPEGQRILAERGMIPVVAAP